MALERWANLLLRAGHPFILHARSEERESEAMAAVPGAEAALVGNLSSIEQTRHLAAQVNRAGTFDATYTAAVG
jgi:hypothetical protein